MTRRLLAVLRQQPIALLALFVALGGTSFAAANASRSTGDVIVGCVGDRSGQLRVVDSARRCGSLETAISFNREGEQGKTGARGKAGDDGTNGRAGAAGKDGAGGAAGSAGPTGATGETGAAGADGEDGAVGQTGATGTDGEDGATGQTGADGEDGDTGPRGLPGADASDAPSDLLTALKTVDGTNSGLDADTLDGVHASALLSTSAFGALFGTPNESATINSTNSDCMMGTITLTGANFAPPGTAFAIGQLISVQQNQALFALIGVTYGGNGSTNFGLPDLRQQSPKGTNYVICVRGQFPGRD